MILVAKYRLHLHKLQTKTKKTGLETQCFAVSSFSRGLDLEKNLFGFGLGSGHETCGLDYITFLLTSVF